MAKQTKVKSDYSYIGTRSIRPDGLDKVTGRANYGADFFLPGMVFGKILRSPFAHATIKAINLEKALALPGVLAVASAKDMPAVNIGGMADEEGDTDFQDFSYNIFARGKVLYDGHAVAAVAATSEHIAEQALALIEVEYEELPVVLDIVQAQEEEAPLLHEKYPGNVARRNGMQRGDIEDGFAAADVVIERTYWAPTVHQAYIEPHACVVSCNEKGQLDIWCSSQGPFMVRNYVAELLTMDVADIKVTPAEIGGGFGGKTTIYLEPVAAILARKSARPVKMVMAREEVFRATGPAAASYCRVKIGATRDGKITAMDGEIAMDAGAFKGAPMNPAIMCLFAPYTCENMRAVGFDIVTNKPKTAAYRAPGAPQAHLGTECVLNEVADELGMDPIELRLLNAVDEGDVALHGPKFQAIGLKTALIAAREHANYQVALQENQGRGVAVGFWFNVGLQSSATVNVTETGRVVVLVGNPDIGGSRASMALMAAETLGIPLTHIKPVVADTESVGFNDLTGGSRTTFATGWAVINACENLIASLKERAAALWDVEPTDISWVNGQAVCAGGEQAPMSLADIAAKAQVTGGPLSVSASLTAKGAAPAFAVNFCDVAIDPETGKIDVLRFTALQDAGKAIHPAYVEGQMQGGAVQGIGWALNEEYVYDDKGILQNAGFLDYRIPVASDLPMIDTHIIEVPSPHHPFGVRGVGEAPICAPMAAVTTAVNHAAGTFETRLPLSPPKMLAAMDALETR